MFLNSLVKVSARVADIACIAQATLKMIHSALLIYNGEGKRRKEFAEWYVEELLNNSTTRPTMGKGGRSGGGGGNFQTVIAVGGKTFV